MNKKVGGGTFRVIVVVALALGLAVAGLAGKGWPVKDSPLDQAVVFVRSISRDTPIRIRDFSMEHTHMGKPKHRDAAEKVAEAARHLLSADLLEALRNMGFKDVGLAEKDSPLPDPCLVIEGEFTIFDAGSQASRIMWGFGSGRSRVCVAGTVQDRAGTVLAKFEHCRKGTGWGKSGSELRKEAHTLGQDIATFLDGWAAGRYVH